MSDSDFILLNQKSMLFETVKLLVSKNRILEITKSSYKILATRWERTSPTLTTVSRFFTEHARPPASQREDGELNALISLS